MHFQALIAQAEQECQPVFAAMEASELRNTRRVLDAFHAEDVAARHFAPTTGYGYDDIGRDTLERIFARLFHAEAAIVRPSIACGTAALSLCLFGLLRPGDHLLSATGAPYDTMQTVIGVAGNAPGNLKEMKVDYSQVEMTADQQAIDVDGVLAALRPNTRVVLIQRSRGYLQRNAFDLNTIKKIADTARAANPDIIIFVDNCYGEFTQTQEPCQVGADIAVGSLIKNPGGGIAPTGGYIVGRRDLVELCAYRLNAPGLGKELGCTLETPRDMYLGFYYAPGVVCEAIKTAIYAQCMLELLGKNPVPRYCDDHNDIVTCFDAGTADALIGFCQGIQAASPVDSYAAPEPSPEPGYTDEVVMASGSFTQGSTIELSCDGPLREPYTCYLQGGLNFAASRAGVLLAIQKAYFKD